MEDAPMTATAATPRPYDPIDLSSRAFWSTTAQEREQVFAQLRADWAVSYLSGGLIAGHLAIMLMDLTIRRYAILLVVLNSPINILCRVSLFLSMVLCLLLRLFVFRLLRLKSFST